MWGDETTVGAGLPILNVLRTDLLATGDKVRPTESIFSRTTSPHFTTSRA
jgi:homoserine dehydrogenase